ncbi:sugar transferase [Promicromonospora thailandica]|uniref:sugar transferase n=1 Tax=Promicromonospora thailandica TaxID=765201 RepID=UPI0020A53F96|nr:sugar transferase [Promicromonospora thailandica]
MNERPARGFHDLRTTLGRSRWQARYQARLRITDAVVVATSAVVAYVLDSTLLFGAPGSPSAVRSLLVPAVVATVWLAALAADKAYDLRVIGRDVAEYKRVLDATWTAASLLAVIAWLTDVVELRDVLAQAVAVPLGVVGLLTGRYAWRQRVMRARRRGTGGLTAVLVVGERAQAERVVSRLNGAPEQGFVAVGACLPPSDDATPADDDLGLPRDKVGADVAGVPVLGGLDRVGEVAALVRASAVAVSTSDTITADEVRRLAWQLERVGVDLMLTTELADVDVERVTVTPASGLSLLHVASPRFDGRKFRVKQAMDWSLAALLTVLVSPVLVAVGAAVALTSRGGLFYLSERVGRGGKIFRMIKFRTMRTGADREVAALTTANDAEGPLFKMRSDPRVTRVGGFLRRYSLDELPQLVNVLLGHMSLVGPRPALPHEVAAYGERMRRRLLVKPGMTGMWQVSGRSDLPWDETVRLDVYYAENWTPFLDVLILARTARAVVSGRGAY